MSFTPKNIQYQPLVYALILVAGISIGYYLLQKKGEPFNVFSLNPADKYSKIDDLLRYISDEYVDSVDLSEITDQTITGILEELDPHSQYIPVEDFEKVNEPLAGNFEGIGIQFRMVDDTVTVLLVIAGGPSQKAGIMAGDRIFKVNEEVIAGKKINDDEIIKKIKGKKGTQVRVSLIRRGYKKPLEFTLTRDVIPTYSIDIAIMTGKETGYIRLSRFAATTYDEFVKAAGSLQKKGMKNLVLDLRGNTGGYLKAATDVADEFLTAKKLIVYTKGYHRDPKYYYATSKGSCHDTRLVILIDGESASASEILAGAIQDNDRGTIVGLRSFGKGLVQGQAKLPDGSAIRLTVARYYTPTGRCIQKPYNKGIESYYHEMAERYENGEMQHADSIHLNDSLKYKTPGGKVVYGGGGIMPDIYIPLNQGRDEFYPALIRSGIFYQYAFNYTDSNRKKLAVYKDADDFKKNFILDGKILSEFLAFAAENGVKPDGKQENNSKTVISTFLKAQIGRSLFGEPGFYSVYLEIDETYKAGVKALADMK